MAKDKAIQIDKMIQLIKDNPCIWDRRDAGYKDKIRREKAWDDVYNGLYPNYEELKEGQKVRIGQQLSKKWFNIRDAYVKSLKDPKRRPYIYSQSLTFLDPVILGEKNSTQDYLHEQSTDGDSEIWLNETFIDVDETEAKRPKLEPKESLEENETMLTLFSKLIQREEDEDRAFFTSITPQVKTLTDNSKLRFRIQVMKLLEKLRNEDILVNIKTNESDSE